MALPQVSQVSSLPASRPSLRGEGSQAHIPPGPHLGTDLQWVRPFHFKTLWGLPLVVQWIRICLPVQGTQIQSLVCKDSTNCGATNPGSHNNWVVCHNYGSSSASTTGAPTPRACAPQKRSHCGEKSPHSMKSRPCSPQLEKTCMQQRRPGTADKCIRVN